MIEGEKLDAAVYYLSISRESSRNDCNVVTYATRTRSQIPGSGLNIISIG